jgi:hypothetical protein
MGGKSREWWEFSVKSAYKLLASATDVGPVVSLEAAIFFQFIRKSRAPSKVKTFAWQLLHDRLPTRSNLQSQGVVLTSSN